MTPYKTPVSVLVVIHTPAAEVLLIERTDSPGFWQSVTGSCESGDSDLVETARREVFEETGIQAAAERFVDWHLSNIYEIYPAWRWRYAPEVTHNTEHLLSLCVAAGTVVQLSPREHTAWQWLEAKAAAERCYSPSNAEAVLQLPRFLAQGVSRLHASRGEK
ncbi:MAG: dihydroneopterin triphosphate diphosphatase [Pseudomonadota bacterium]